MLRRDILGGGVTLIAATLAMPKTSAARTASSLPDDPRFMEEALKEAAAAAFPFGCVIVKDGDIIARGHNRTGLDHDPTAHGEMVAIRACISARGPDVLKGATLYTSGEPCCMCMGAILWCGIGRLVYAASLNDLSAKLDQIGLSAEDVATKAPFAPISITGGVLGEKAMTLFKS